jgi:AsmA protein
MLRLKRKRRIAMLMLGIPTAPALLWGLILLLAPTGWAKDKLVTELETLTGRKVTIGAIALGPLGNLRIKDVQIAEKGNVEAPWIKVGEAKLDLHIVQLLGGCCKTTDILVDGLDLRVHRDKDGKFDFGDLLDGGGSTGSTQTGTSDSAATPRSVTLTITNARVLLDDEKTATRLELAEANGTANWNGSIATIPTLSGRFNGGTLEFAAKYDRSQTPAGFEAELRTHDASMTVGMKALGLLVPVLGDGENSIDGKVDLEIVLRGQIEELEAFKKGLKGSGSVRLNPIDLSRSKLLDSLDALRQFPTAGRVGSVESDFGIEGGKIITDDLTLKVSKLPIILTGWTDFDGRLDYHVKTDAMHERIASKLPKQARAIFADVKQELGDLAEIHIFGTVDDPKVAVGQRPLDGRGRGRADTEARLRDAARRLGSKYLK